MHRVVFLFGPHDVRAAASPSLVDIASTSGGDLLPLEGVPHAQRMREVGWSPRLGLVRWAL